MLGAEEQGVIGGVGLGEIEEVAPGLPRGVGCNGTGGHGNRTVRGEALVGACAQGRQIAHGFVGGRGIHGGAGDEEAAHRQGGGEDQHRQHQKDGGDGAAGGGSGGLCGDHGGSRGLSHLAHAGDLGGIQAVADLTVVQVQPHPLLAGMAEGLLGGGLGGLLMFHSQASPFCLRKRWMARW